MLFQGLDLETLSDPAHSSAIRGDIYLDCHSQGLGGLEQMPLADGACFKCVARTEIDGKRRKRKTGDWHTAGETGEGHKECLAT